MGEHNIPKLQLTIRVDPDGQISVHGPIHDKIFCLGLLEIAKKIVIEHKVQQPKIIVPQIVTGPIKAGN